ncbi:MAG TPA: DUF4112 domain-containing protein [Azospirillum sp.]|nr:DUF4112 domain-containing protein [Azospirillum sp.]
MAYSPSRRARAESADPDRLERLHRLTWWLDTRWTIPGTRIGVGLDGIASLVPVAGDTLTALVSLHIINEASHFGVPKSLIARMLGNVALDWLLGSVPVIGTIFDIGFKSNVRNLRLLHRHLNERMGATAVRRGLS